MTAELPRPEIRHPVPGRHRPLAPGRGARPPARLPGRTDAGRRGVPAVAPGPGGPLDRPRRGGWRAAHAARSHRRAADGRRGAARPRHRMAARAALHRRRHDGSGIGDPDVLARTITIYTDVGGFQRALAIRGGEEVHALVVTRDGTILARGSGDPQDREWDGDPGGAAGRLRRRARDARLPPPTARIASRGTLPACATLSPFARGTVSTASIAHSATSGR